MRRTAWILALALSSHGFQLARAADEAPLRAYHAARIIVAPGKVVENGHLLVKGSAVEGVLSSGEKLPGGAAVVELLDATITPGFVNPLSVISERTYRGGAGAVPSSPARDPRDARGASAAGAVKPEDSVWRRLGRSGYAAFGWLPDSAGFLAGQAAVVRPSRGRAKDREASALVLKESSFLLLSFEAGKRWRDVAEGELKKAADVIAKENEALKKAEEKKAEEKKAAEAKPEEKKAEEKKPDEKKAAAPQAAPAQPAAPPKPPDPLVKALKGELPLFIRVRTPAALDHFFRFFDALGPKPSFVLVTAPLPDDIVIKLAKRRDRLKGVVIEPRVESFWDTSVLVSSGRLFLEKEIPVAFAPLSDTLEGHERMPLYLAEMVKCGLTPAEVLAAVTTAPAQMLGLEGKLGRLEKGAFSSFCAYRGDPLGGSARLVKAFVEGEEVFSDDPETSNLTGEALK